MRQGRAISIVEVIIAVVLLGVLAALAIPRLSRATEAPDEAAALRRNLSVLRVAIDLYYQDHAAFPGARADGRDAGATEAAFVAQLTRFTDPHGQVSDHQDAAHCYGPYLRDGVPPCPVPPAWPRAGVHMISGPGVPAFVGDAPEAGWVYNYQTGQVAANSNAVDATGRPYASY